VLSAKFKRPRFYISATIVLCALIAVGMYVRNRQVAPPELAFSEFLAQIEKGQVKQVRFAEGAITLTLADNSTAITVPPPSFLAADTAFVTNLAQRGVRIEIQQIPEPGALTPGSIALAVFFLSLLGFTVYRTTAGRIHTPGKAKLAERGGQVVTFQDVAGVDEAKDEVKEIVDFLRHPGRFSTLGGRTPHWTPGNGQDPAGALDRR
jgi:cell division protease FtsH